MELSAVLLDANQLFADHSDFARLASAFDRFRYYPTSTPAETVKRLQQATVALTNGTPLNEQILQQLPKLKLILVGGTGTEYVDLFAARALGIAVYNCQEYAADSLAQHTIALLLGLTNHLLNWRDELLTDAWQKAGTFCLLTEEITELVGKTLVIVGYGATGKRVKALAEAFGMHVELAELPGRTVREGRTSLDSLLPIADVVSLHCPLTSETKGLFSAERFALMKHSALLLNIARGEIIDELALVDALMTGKIRGAGLDVFHQEPLLQTNPLLSPAVSTKVVLTPHVAWASKRARHAMIEQLIENITSFQHHCVKRLVN